MVQFPDIQQPVYPFTTKIKDPSLQSEMENGLVISRARFTRAPQTFTLKWTALPAADYAALRNFYCNAVYGGSLAARGGHFSAHRTIKGKKGGMNKKDTIFI